MFQEVVSEERVRLVCDGRSFDFGVDGSSSMAGERRLLAPRNDWHLHGRICELPVVNIYSRLPARLLLVPLLYTTCGRNCHKDIHHPHEVWTVHVLKEYFGHFEVVDASTGSNIFIANYEIFF